MSVAILRYQFKHSTALGQVDEIRVAIAAARLQSEGRHP